MPLTPEDVVNKRFQPTKFREGYDQDEVDDFLDEIVIELRRLNLENEDLRQRLLASEARIAELQRSGAGLANQLTTNEPSVPTFGSLTALSQPEASSFPVATDPSQIDGNSTNNLLQARCLDSRGACHRSSRDSRSRGTAARRAQQIRTRARNARAHDFGTQEF